MRAFVLMVLVLNLIFFAWQYLGGSAQQGEDEKVVVPTAAEWVVPSLALVSEVPSIVIEVKEAPSTVQSDVVAVVEQAVVDSHQVEQSDSSPEVERVAEADRAAKVAAPPQPVALCYKVGPFEKRTKPLEMVEMAERNGFDTAITARQVERFFGEWIYLADYDTLRAARADVAVLKREGIKDIAIARLDDGRLVISLGIFGQQATLEERLREVEALGYVNHQRRKRYRKAEEFWLVLSGFEGAQQQSMVDELNAVLDERFPAVEVKKVDCG